MFSFQALIVFALVFLKTAFAEHQEVKQLATILLKLLSVLSRFNQLDYADSIVRYEYTDTISIKFICFHFHAS